MRILARRSAAAAPLLAALLVLGAERARAQMEAPEGEPSVVAQAAGEDETTEGEQEPAAPPPEPASPSGEPPQGIEVLHVRGRSVGSLESEVPASVTQFDASTIEALGAQDISDLSRVTPNVNIVQPGSTQATFFVRGIGLSDFSSNAQGAVTIFQDDVALNAPAIQTGQLYDIEGVEIVRGPQGTGPYRNASAGAIRVRSRRPTGNHGAFLRSSFGRYDTEGDKGAHEALIQDYEGALEMPLVADALSSRFAFRLREADPYKTNGCGNALPIEQRLPRPKSKDPWTIDDPRVRQCGEGSQLMGPGIGLGAQVSQIPVGLPEKVNDEHNWAARGTLRFQPPDSEIELLLNGHGSRLDQDSTLGQAIGTSGKFGGASSSSSGGYQEPDTREEFEKACVNRTPTGGCATPLSDPAGPIVAENLAEDRPLDIRPYRGDYDRVGQTTRDTWGTFVSGEAPIFGETKLFGLASWDQYERFSDTDTDFTPDRLFETIQGDKAWQTYEELRLSGELEAEPVQWELGAYYLQEDLHVRGSLLTAAGSLPSETQREYDQVTYSTGAWGGFGWDFADDFTLEGGVRFNFERKNFNFKLQQFIAGITTADLQQKTHETWQTPTGQIVLTYHIDEDKAVYARYARGFKAGHFNALASDNLDDPPADEEYNDSWEAGLRGSWFSRRLSLAGAFFYYRYENYQIFLFTDAASGSAPPVLEILNAKEAENFGIEVETTLMPLRGWAPRLVEGLRISGNFSWLHGEYIDFATTRIFTFSGSVPNPGTFAVPVDYSGQALQNSPEYKVSATLEWTLDLGRFGYLIPRYDVNWSDHVFFDPNEGHGSVDPSGGPSLRDYAIGQKAFFLHNARLAYRTPTGNVEVAAWVRNIEDQVYKNFAFDVSRFTGIVINFPGEPRTIGMDFTVTF